MVRPYSNWYVAAAFCGFTVPFRVAPAEVMLVAADVVTAGAIAVVVNVWLLPFVVPAEFVATTRK